VFFCDGLRPLFDRVSVNFDGGAAFPTHQVVVVPRVTRPIHRFAAFCEDIGLTAVSQSAKCPINGCQADPRPTLTQVVVKLLGAHKIRSSF
jgi:hypothetical protein